MVEGGGEAIDVDPTGWITKPPDGVGRKSRTAKKILCAIRIFCIPTNSSIFQGVLHELHNISILKKVVHRLESLGFGGQI